VGSFIVLSRLYTYRYICSKHKFFEHAFRTSPAIASAGAGCKAHVAVNTNVLSCPFWWASGIANWDTHLQSAPPAKKAQKGSLEGAFFAFVATQDPILHISPIGLLNDRMCKASNE